MKYILIDAITNKPLMIGKTEKACQIYAVKREIAKAISMPAYKKRLSKKNICKVYYQNCSKSYSILTLPIYSEDETMCMSWLNFYH